jgi:hypothetical protein
MIVEIGMSKVGTKVWFHSCVECVDSTCGSTYTQDGCSRKWNPLLCASIDADGVHVGYCKYVDNVFPL